MPNAFQFRSILGMGQTNSNEEGNFRADGRDGLNNGTKPKAKRPNRPLQVRENLDDLIRQIEHARRGTDQIMDEMSALEVDAEQAHSLRNDNMVLREKLDESGRQILAETAKAETAQAEIARLKDDLAAIRQDYEKSAREADANAQDAARIEDRLRLANASLDETRLDLEVQREAKDKAEVDAACLRANLTERDRAQNALMQQETELRMQVAKLQSQYEKVTDALTRKERMVLEKSAELEATNNRIAQMESDADSARDEIRMLNTKFADFKVSQEARIFSLNDGLSQERESHRLTRKLLDEARANNESLSDESALFKDQGILAAKDSQNLKRELSTVRSQVHEYADKLKDAHLRIDSAHSDIQRLETALDEAKKDGSTLRRQANKSEQLLRENAELHEKLTRLKRGMERRRSKDLLESELLDDVPIMLSSTKRNPAARSAKPKVKSAAPTSQNVARIRRR